MARWPLQVFFFFHLIQPLHNFFGDFICFNDGTGPPLGEYFILFSIFFSWSNLFKFIQIVKLTSENQLDLSELIG